MLVHEVLSYAPAINLTINPLNAELNPICHLLAILGTHHIFHFSRVRVKHGRETQVCEAVRRLGTTKRTVAVSGTSSEHKGSY